MSCKEIKTDKYQNRNSPPYHAKDCKNITKKGKDGNYISKPDAKGIYKWIKVKENIKAYYIHDNGARPYKVEVSDKSVEIYSGIEYNELVKSLTVKEIYIGQSPCNNNIYISDACGVFGKGNSILLHLNEKKYMYVGHEIYLFKIDDDVEAYYSVIGNNDVPYPVLLGTKYVYFMLDYEYIPRDLFKAKMNSFEWADAYAYYMGYKDYNTGELITCSKNLSVKERTKCYKQRGEELQKIHEGNKKKMKGLKMIRKR